MLFKAFFGCEQIAQSGKFWEGFVCVVQPFLQDGCEKKPIFAFARASFQEKSFYEYFLVLESFEQREKPFCFPISGNTSVFLNSEDQLTSFELRTTPDTLFLEFPPADESYDSAGQFREIIGRLLFQTSSKKSINECQNIEQEIRNRVETFEKANKMLPSTQLKKVISEVPNLGILFLSAGRFALIDSKLKKNLAKIIENDCAIGVRSRGGFLYELFVISKNAKEIYCRKLTEGFHYYADTSRRALTWLDFDFQPICYQFLLFEKSPKELHKQITTCVIESQNKEIFSEVMARYKNDWDKFYLTPSERIHQEERTFPSSISELRKLECDHDFNTPSYGEELKYPIRLFQQAKLEKLCYVNRNIKTEVYSLKADKQHEIEFKTTLPLFQFGEENIIPRQMLLVEKDERLALLDEKNLGSLFYFDIEKGKLVHEWKSEELFSEIAIAGGKMCAKDLLVLTKKKIILVDPRQKSQILREAHYRTDFTFEKIIGITNNNLVVGSANGDLRLYNQVAQKAQNLIPAPIRGSIRSIDCTKNGKLLLVTYENSILLLPTFQGRHSAFSYTFSKCLKPQALLLKISLQAIARYNIKKISFCSAKFDEKESSKENYIIAAMEDFFILWNLNEVLEGNVASSQIKKINRIIVGGEFCYDNDNILGVSRSSLFLQKTRKISLSEVFNKR